MNIDLYYSKSRYAQEINGIMPKISNSQEIEVFDAYHPLLYRSNIIEEIKTYPQDIFLNSKNKIIVITGLSGSGKSSLAFDTLYATKRFFSSPASR